jgi:hypothetical protein
MLADQQPALEEDRPWQVSTVIEYGLDAGVDSAALKYNALEVRRLDNLAAQLWPDKQYAAIAAYAEALAYFNCIRCTAGWYPSFAHKLRFCLRLEPKPFSLEQTTKKLPLCVEEALWT